MTVPAGWSCRPLADVVSARSGNSKIIKGMQSPVPGNGLFQAYSASGPDVWVATAEHQGPGVVISAVGARCGKTFLAEGAWTAIANTHVLKPYREIEPKYLWYLTNNERFWIKSGTAQPFVKVKDTLARPHLLPPLEEQRRIIDMIERYLSPLDVAGRYVASVQGLSTSLRAGILGQLVDAKRHCRLGDLARVKGGFAFPSAGWRDAGIPVVKIANVRNGRVDLTRCSFVDSTTASASSDFSVGKGDLLVTLTGEIGATGLYAAESEARLNQRVGRIDVYQTDLVDRRFLRLVLESPLVRREMWAAAKGMAQPNISPKQIENLVIPVPDLGEQRMTVERVEGWFSRLDASEDLLALTHKRDTTLRRAVFDAAFSGRLEPGLSA